MFGGAVSAMITSLKNNKRTRVNTLDRLKLYQKDANIKGENSKEKIKASPELLKEIRERKRKENKKALIFNVVFTLVFIAIVFILLKFAAI